MLIGNGINKNIKIQSKQPITHSFHLVNYGGFVKFILKSTRDNDMLYINLPRIKVTPDELP